jgi:hypothetical protein
MSSLRFYTDLEGFHDFQEALLDTRYHPVPEDWWIVITDVIGSTKAIEEGRYKEVNTIGASTLAALRNVMPDILFPFVFGGDGASAIIPGEYKDKTCREGYALAMTTH